MRRRTHRSPEWAKERVGSYANTLTFARVVVATGIIAFAANEGSHLLVMVGLVVGWVADVADGGLARKSHRETVLGAQLDAQADRLTALVATVASVILADGSTTALVVAAVVWLQFGVADQMLFGQFLSFGLWTPDEFHLVHVNVWRLCWSSAAKLAGGVPVALMVVGGFAGVLAIAAAIPLIAVRIWCYLEIAKLRPS